MAYRIVFNKAVANQIRQLPGHIKAAARQQIASLSNLPRLPQSKELDGHPDYYRSWLGPKYRLVWHVDDEAEIVTVRYVGPKTPDLYALLGLDRPSQDDDGQ